MLAFVFSWRLDLPEYPYTVITESLAWLYKSLLEIRGATCIWITDTGS